MSAAVKGKQVTWGIAAAIKTFATAALTDSGIVEGFELEPGGEVDLIGDEDNDVVTRIDHKKINKFTLEVFCVSATVLPAMGAEMTVTALGTLDGVNFATGRAFVDVPKVVYNQAGVKKLSLSCSHYPAMAADA